MLVKEWMTKTLITVYEEASIGQAIELLVNNHISMLPVLAEGKLVGMVTKVELNPFIPGALPASGGNEAALVLSRIKVGDVMSRAPVTVPLDYTVEETADVLLRNEVSGVAVVDRDHRVIGVITQTDINRVLVSVTGLWRGGIVFGVLLEDRPGSIKEITDILRSYGGRLASILTSYERTAKNCRRVHIRVRGLDRSQLPQIKDELRQRATLEYMIDFREGTREIYEE
jgi:acetoin utilization protein AcuB